MARQPLPDDAMAWEQDGREFVQFAEEMYIYEYDENDQLARVLAEDLPVPPGMNPDTERFRQELLAAEAES